MKKKIICMISLSFFAMSALMTGCAKSETSSGNSANTSTIAQSVASAVSEKSTETTAASAGTSDTLSDKVFESSIDITYIPGPGGGTWKECKNDYGTYYSVPCIVNGEIKTYYMTQDENHNTSVEVPGVYTNLKVDEKGFIQGGTSIVDYDSSEYEVGTELTGTKLLDDGTVEMGWFDGPNEGGSGYLNGSKEQNAEPTIRAFDKNTRVYNYVEGTVTLNPNGIEGMSDPDFNDKCAFYAENGVVKEIYIVN